jgi:hypothetical protein
MLARVAQYPFGRVSPVRQTNPRTVVIAVATFALGAIAVLVVFLVAVNKTSGSGSIQVNLGDETFNAGDAESRAQTIADGGPILFSDVAGGQRDIFLQHQGGDVKTGWLAFDVRTPGQARDCMLQWDNTAKAFHDSCGGATFPADGGPLPHYPATVNDDGDVIVDLNPDKKRPTTTTAPPETSTTSTIKITGGSVPR